MLSLFFFFFICPLFNIIVTYESEPLHMQYENITISQF